MCSNLGSVWVQVFTSVPVWVEVCASSITWLYCTHRSPECVLNGSSSRRATKNNFHQIVVLSKLIDLMTKIEPTSNAGEKRTGYGHNKGIVWISCETHTHSHIVGIQSSKSTFKHLKLEVRHCLRDRVAVGHKKLKLLNVF